MLQSIVTLVVLFAAFLKMKRTPLRKSHGEIANLLVHLHGLWAANGYQSPDGEAVAGLETPSMTKAGAGPLNAFVQYRKGWLGVSYSTTYYLERSKTNSPVWNLLETTTLDGPVVPTVTRKSYLTSVTNVSK